ncbi:MAG: hypothetical protein IPJ40_22815 [Saprospirales bacterium]|nr:hypothetical protein [Saprospirales bacterium]
MAEIENRKVLEDFAGQAEVKDRNYQIVHYDSPDGRGIDVALLYNPKYYKVLSSRPIPMGSLESNGEMIMGDLNDDPISPSVKNVLWAKRNADEVRAGGLFNPMWDLYAKGNGTLAYNDAWNLFDQIMVSYGLVNKDTGGYNFYQARVFNKPFLVQKSGNFKGTWAGIVITFRCMCFC